MDSALESACAVPWLGMCRGAGGRGFYSEQDRHGDSDSEQGLTFPVALGVNGFLRLAKATVVRVGEEPV